MTTFIMTVGLPGSGKSYWAEEHKNQYNAVVLSSDSIRKEKYGDEKIQGNNNLLFEEIHNLIIHFLKNNTNVIFDATNISYKNRKALLNKINNLDVNKICILFATQYDICLERNANRERHVPEAVIKRMRESFNVPLKEEGWDDTQIIYEYNPEDYKIEDYLSFADTYDQKNYHHTMTLGHHSRKVAEYVAESKVDENIRLAALLHDCGKPLTQVFQNMKGEPSEIGHYYFHENCGAYESLFYLNDDVLRLYDREILFSAGLINFHMRPYLAKTDKAKKKLEDTIGSDMYYFLDILHQADKRAH